MGGHWETGPSSKYESLEKQLPMMLELVFDRKLLGSL